MNIAQKKYSEKIIINLIKIEQIIKMWKKINHLTKPKHNNAIHTIDILVDSSVGWNDIKKDKNLQFKTIDNPQLIDKLINERNAQHLN